MGYTALRMSLRRIAETEDVSDSLLDAVSKRIGDREEARASRTLPVAFYSAYKNTPLEFAPALQRAANASLSAHSRAVLSFSLIRPVQCTLPCLSALV